MKGREDNRRRECSLLPCFVDLLFQLFSLSYHQRTVLTVVSNESRNIAHFLYAAHSPLKLTTNSLPGAPVISEGVRVVNTTEGEQASLTCSIIGEEHQIQWYKVNAENENSKVSILFRQ